jgi:endonuclease-3
MLIKTTVNKIFALFAKLENNPTTELVYNSHFELLVAVVLSAQATDISVNKATAQLYKVANTPQQMVALGINGISNYIKTIGLYNTKAHNIWHLSKILIESYNSQVPGQFEQLISLPGVGRKTANVILNTLFAKPVIAVDTHVFRVSKRLGIANGNSVEIVEQQLQQNIPNKFKYNAHHWLILHGRYICKAQKPLCNQCCVNKYCQHYAI